MSRMARIQASRMRQACSRHAACGMPDEEHRRQHGEGEVGSGKWEVGSGKWEW